MAINRADVVEAEFLKEGAGYNHSLDMFFNTAGKFQHAGYIGQNLATCTTCRIESAAGKQTCQVFIHAANRRRNRHIVVIEDHQQIGVKRPRIIQCLESLAGRHGAVTDNGDHSPFFIFVSGGNRHPERGGNRRGRVANAKRVINAFRAPRESGDAMLHAQVRHAFTASGEYLVGIGLMAHIPHQPVFRRVKYIVQGDGELNCAKVRR